MIHKDQANEMKISARLLSTEDQVSCNSTLIFLGNALFFPPPFPRGSGPCFLLLPHEGLEGDAFRQVSPVAADSRL